MSRAVFELAMLVGLVALILLLSGIVADAGAWKEHDGGPADDTQCSVIIDGYRVVLTYHAATKPKQLPVEGMVCSPRSQSEIEIFRENEKLWDDWIKTNSTRKGNRK